MACPRLVLFFSKESERRWRVLGFAVCVGHRPLEGSIVTIVFELWALGPQWTLPCLVLCLPALIQMALGSGLPVELGSRQGWVPYLLANVYFLFNLNV